MRDSHQLPPSKKILERPLENCIPHPNRYFFLRGFFFVNRRCAAALAFPDLLGDGREPSIHGDYITVFLKKISRDFPIRLAWYLSNPILGAWPCLNIHRTSSTEGTPGSWEAVQNDFWGVCLSKQASPIGSFSCPDKNRKS